MREISKIFKALSDPNRLRILKMLEVRPLCVCEIRAVLDLATSTVSRHLSVLRDAGFITDRKDAKWVNYELSDGSRQNMIQDLMPLLQKWLPTDNVVLQDLEKVKTVDRNLLCQTTDATA